MTINEYLKLAMTTLNPDLTKKDVLNNGVMGLCGESGECIDIVKRHLAQGHELNREKQNEVSKKAGKMDGNVPHYMIAEFSLVQSDETVKKYMNKGEKL